jgi:pyrimidine-nucleoside phosphorylase
MNPVQLILNKRNGGAHSAEEIRYLVESVTNGQLESYQLSAWLMAVWFKGMNEDETEVLTQAMVESGDQVDLSAIAGVKVDKHSTGGVGDGTTLLVAPIVAAAGGKVAKMSGRGLGHTGGTLDKLESIPGMRVDLSSERFIAQVQDIGLAVISQTGRLVPADGLMYAMRDVTGTVDSIPLIAASVMSKKLACGAEAIVLDVKFGDGAFMKSYADAKKLAECMVSIGRRRGRRVMAALSSMEQPLGNQIGNALEVDEALQVLRGEALGSDLAEVAFSLAAQLMVLAKLVPDFAAGLARSRELVVSGAARRKFAEMIKAQGGDPRVVDDPSLLPRAPLIVPIHHQESGYVSAFHAEAVGLAAMRLGAGRMKKTDVIDPSAGVILRSKVSDRVEPGQLFAELHAHDGANIEEVTRLLRGSLTLTAAAPVREPLIREFVGSSS